MNFDIDELEKRLNRSSEISKGIDEKNKLKIN